MKIFPAIDLKNGKCVRLTKGDFKSEKIYNENPMDQAEIFSNAGFKYIHIIDLDGALEGSLVNLSVIEKIVLALSKRSIHLIVRPFIVPSAKNN